MKYCILGGGGSFGLQTADFLLKQDDTEKVLSIGRGDVKPRCFSLGVGDSDPRYEYKKLHVTYDFGKLVAVLSIEQPDVIINFAAQGEGATSFTQSWRYFETNCVGLARLIEWLVQHSWLKKFIHIGSSEVYGATNGPAHETDALNPTSPYAISKAAFDQYLLAVRKKFGLPAIILRPSNAYGPGQQLHRIVPKALLLGLTGRKLPLHGGGRAEKSYIYTKDLARAIYLVATKGSKEPIYNLGPENPTTIKNVVERIAARLGMRFDELCEIADDREHQDSRYWLDSLDAGRDFGWRPEVNWDEGLTYMYDWVSENLDELRNLPTEFEMRP